MLDILIIMNNYFHDVATATLLSSAVILWVLGRRAELGGPQEVAALERAYPTLTRFARGALAWIILGGIPRMIFFYSHEFIPASTMDGPYLVPALIVKHSIIVFAVVLGVLLWRRMARVANIRTAPGKCPVTG